jgi:hypothetical protein
MSCENIENGLIKPVYGQFERKFILGKPNLTYKTLYFLRWRPWLKLRDINVSEGLVASICTSLHLTSLHCEVGLKNHVMKLHRRESPKSHSADNVKVRWPIHLQTCSSTNKAECVQTALRKLVIQKVNSLSLSEPCSPPSKSLPTS